LKQFLTDLIAEAGRISLEYRDRLGDLKISRKTPKDLVTEADVAVEKYIVAKIKEAYPQHSIFGEESGQHSGNEYRWIIDPIDGTTSFVHHQPFYAVSIALEKAGELILAAVNAPVLGELFEAQKGKGATLNGKEIHVSESESLPESVLATGFACLRSDLSHNNLPYFNRIAPVVRGIRRFGSAAIDMCYVAAGRMDGFWELNLKIYDVAAGILILNEAGGKVTDFSDQPIKDCFEIVATNNHIHKELTTILSDVIPLKAKKCPRINL